MLDSRSLEDFPFVLLTTNLFLLIVIQKKSLFCMIGINHTILHYGKTPINACNLTKRSREGSNYLGSSVSVSKFALMGYDTSELNQESKSFCLLKFFLLLHLNSPLRNSIRKFSLQILNSLCGAERISTSIHKYLIFAFKYLIPIIQI